MGTHWVIDWNKVQSLDDVKTLLRSLDLQPRPLHPEFSNYKSLCKLIDDDGREVVETASAQESPDRSSRL